MPCEVHADPDIFGGAQFFMCGDGFEYKPCAFCGAEGPYLCDWPVTRFESVMAHDVRIGDVIRDSTDADRAIEMRVLGIEPRGLVLRFQIEFLHVPKKSRACAVKYRCRGFVRWDRAAVLRAESGTCDQACCEAHAREIGEDRHYCREHWQAWQEVS